VSAPLPSSAKTTLGKHNATPADSAWRGLADVLPSLRRGGTTACFLLFAAGLVSFAIGLFAGANTRDVPLAPFPPPPAMSQCTADTTALLRPDQNPSADILRDAREHCYSLIHSHGLLKDFATRELNFIQQFRANGVLMWMVVAVTLSGVLLAALQLMASYELARSNRKSPVGDSEFSVKRDRVVLKSSITGLFILVMSFAFFLVFVFYVYRFEQIESHAFRMPPQTAILPLGGLGPPAQAK
jgi:hypothetical protein